MLVEKMTNNRNISNIFKKNLHKSKFFRIFAAKNDYQQKRIERLERFL